MILAFQVVEGGQRVRVFGMRLAKLHHVMSDVCRRPFVAMPSRKFRRLDDGGEGGSECAWRPKAKRPVNPRSFGNPPRHRDLLRRRFILHGKYLMPQRSEEHTSELQSLMRISYAVFCLKT